MAKYMGTMRPGQFRPVDFTKTFSPRFQSNSHLVQARPPWFLPHTTAHQQRLSVLPQPQPGPLHTQPPRRPAAAASVVGLLAFVVVVVVILCFALWLLLRPRDLLLHAAGVIADGRGVVGPHKCRFNADPTPPNRCMGIEQFQKLHHSHRNSFFKKIPVFLYISLRWNETANALCCKMYPPQMARLVLLQERQGPKRKNWRSKHPLHSTPLHSPGKARKSRVQGQRCDKLWL